MSNLYALSLFFVFFILLGCKPQSEQVIKISPEPTLSQQFYSAMKDRERLIFGDSSKLGASMDGSIMNMHFFKDGRLFVETFGNGFSQYVGKYQLSRDGQLKVLLQNQEWPILVISKDEEGYRIHRKDGLLSLTNHIVVKGPDGSIVDRYRDFDIYPEAEGKIFPFVQKSTAEPQR